MNKPEIKWDQGMVDLLKQDFDDAIAGIKSCDACISNTKLPARHSIHKALLLLMSAQWEMSNLSKEYLNLTFTT